MSHVVVASSFRLHGDCVQQLIHDIVDGLIAERSGRAVKGMKCLLPLLNSAIMG
jgi:hypothetical protein